MCGTARNLCGSVTPATTHPSDEDRCASVERECADGIFHFDEPAAMLFSDFDKLATETSLAFYRKVFGSRLQRSNLQSIEEVLASA
jgi:hypothetical protein